MLAQVTNIIVDPSGGVWAADSEMGFYWAGFGVGLLFFGFGLIWRMARGLRRETPDF